VLFLVGSERWLAAVMMTSSLADWLMTCFSSAKNKPDRPAAVVYKYENNFCCRSTSFHFHSYLVVSQNVQSIVSYAGTGPKEEIEEKHHLQVIKFSVIKWRRHITSTVCSSFLFFTFKEC